jgi:hypothetical protein
MRASSPERTPGRCPCHPAKTYRPPTGKQIRMRSCDIAHVERGLITTHHFYFDQMEFLGQLGLLPESLSKL